MRVILAAFFVLVSTFGTVAVIGSHYDDAHWPWWSLPHATRAFSIEEFEDERPHYYIERIRRRDLPSDGDVITAKTYEELRAES